MAKRSAKERVHKPVKAGTVLVVGTVAGAAGGVRDGLDETIGRGKTTAILMLIGLIAMVVLGSKYPDPRAVAIKEAAQAKVAEVVATPMAQQGPAKLQGAAAPEEYPTAGIAQANTLRDFDCPYKAEFKAAGEKYDIPWQVIAALAKYESAYNANAVSSDGYASRGLCQIIPTTWRLVTDWPWDDAFDPGKNTMAAAKYLDQIRGQVVKPGMSEADIVFAMVCGYNWGPGNVTSQGRDAAPAVTRAYAYKIVRDAGYLD